mgnify:CR=1 FL=1
MNENFIEYEGFYGSVKYLPKDEIFHGKIVGIDSLIMFGGRTVDELKNDFHAAVDEYIQTCKKLGIEPLKSFKGSFNVRISPDQHRLLALTAKEKGTTINNLVSQAIRYTLENIDIVGCP